MNSVRLGIQCRFSFDKAQCQYAVITPFPSPKLSFPTLHDETLVPKMSPQLAKIIHHKTSGGSAVL